MPSTNLILFMPTNLILFMLFLLPISVLGECTCEPEDEPTNTAAALKYKIAAIASILIAGALGVCIPMLGKKVSALRPDKNIFFIVKAFAAGVILATAFIHILPDAFENLTSPCISQHPWGDFPFAGFISMMAAIGTLMIDTVATSYFGRRSRMKAAAGVGDEESVVPVHTHATHGHAHGSVSLELNSGETEFLRHRVISQVLEMGIVVHSVIIGIALGASQSPETIKPLVAALSFHQFFEGLGLGGCIAQAKFNSRAVALMALFFSMTTPIGIGVGIGISHIYSETSPTALIMQGVFDSASSGILIYMSLVDLLSADFMSPKLQSNGKLQFWAYVSLLIGAGCMSILAKWA